MAACDTVILFDLPVEVCLEGITSRLGKKRPDMPWIDTEPDPRLVEEILEFPTRNLPAIYDLMETYKDGRERIILRSREEADAFLAGLGEISKDRDGMNFSPEET